MKNAIALLGVLLASFLLLGCIEPEIGGEAHDYSAFDSASQGAAVSLPEDMRFTFSGTVSSVEEILGEVSCRIGSLGSLGAELGKTYTAEEMKQRCDAVGGRIVQSRTLRIAVQADDFCHFENDCRPFREEKTITLDYFAPKFEVKQGDSIAGLFGLVYPREPEPMQPYSEYFDSVTLGEINFSQVFRVSAIEANTSVNAKQVCEKVKQLIAEHNQGVST